MSSRPSRGAARLAAILDALPDALVLVNCNGTVVNANTIALERLEAPGTALVGRGLLDLLPEFDSRLIPGSMRRPDTIDEQGRTRPTRMTARRTDGAEFPVEVTSASLAEGRESGWGAPSQFGTGAADQRYTGDELLMIVVRDLSGAVDTEAELARSQRQTEMILRAAAEGVVGTDTDGRVVLVNPAAAQILGFRAGDLGGREFHTLVLHSRADGEPFPYAESPLADTLRSGRKHRVRGQVLWAKDGSPVPVDLTTAPVRDGDQLVGAVVTFTDRRAHEALVAEHAEEQAAAEKRYEELAEREQRRYEELETSSTEKYAELERTSRERYEELERTSTEKYQELERTSRERYETLERESTERYEALAEREKERYAALGEREKDRYEALAARHDQLVAVLSDSLRGPLDHLRSELGSLAADPAGQLWPEANQILHHLSAGYARMTTLVDNVLGYQRLDAGQDTLDRKKVLLDEVIAAGVEGAVELIGPGRAQFAVHAPSIEAEIDPHRFATALAHLIADVAGIDATGNARQTPQAMAGGYIDSTVVVAAALRGNAVRIEVRGPFAGGDPVHEPLVRGIVRAHGGVLQTHAMPGMSGSAYVLDVPLGEGAGAVQAPPQAELPAGGTPEQAPEGTTPDAESERPHGRRRRRAAPRSSVDSFLGASTDGTPATPEPAPAAAPTGRRRGRRAADETPVEAVLAGQDGGETPAAGSAVALPAPTGAAEGGTGRRRRRAAAPQDENAPTSEGAVTTAAEHAAGTAASASALGGTVPPQGVPPAGLRAAQPALPPAGSAGPGAAVVIRPGSPPRAHRRRAAPAQAPDDQQGRAVQRPAPSAMPALPPAGAPAPAQPTPPGTPNTPPAPVAPAPAVGTPGETVQATVSAQPNSAPAPGQAAPQAAPAPVAPAVRAARRPDRRLHRDRGPRAADPAARRPEPGRGARPGSGPGSRPAGHGRPRRPGTARSGSPRHRREPRDSAADTRRSGHSRRGSGPGGEPRDPGPARRSDRAGCGRPRHASGARVPAARHPAGSGPARFPGGCRPAGPARPARPPALRRRPVDAAVRRRPGAPGPRAGLAGTAGHARGRAGGTGSRRRPRSGPGGRAAAAPARPVAAPRRAAGGPASSSPSRPRRATPTARGRRQLRPGTPGAPVGAAGPAAGLPPSSPPAQPGVPGQQPVAPPTQVPPGAAYPAAPWLSSRSPRRRCPGSRRRGPGGRAVPSPTGPGRCRERRRSPGPAWPFPRRRTRTGRRVTPRSTTPRRRRTRCRPPRLRCRRRRRPGGRRSPRPRPTAGPCPRRRPAPCPCPRRLPPPRRRSRPPGRRRGTCPGSRRGLRRFHVKHRPSRHLAARRPFHVKHPARPRSPLFHVKHRPKTRLLLFHVKHPQLLRPRRRSRSAWPSRSRPSPPSSRPPPRRTGRSACAPSARGCPSRRPAVRPSRSAAR
ncbi:PAS domain-containing protein [Streptomyces koyangensis]|uniref:PAS domain-containing protein n=1 Tax=Streptomyces koyangensis TaxID=188770 RepID=UPI001CEC1E8B